MLEVVPASQAKVDIYALMDKASQAHEPVLITGEKNNVVMISQEDWEAIQETLYLNSIPNLAKSIKKTMNEPDSKFSETIEW